MAHEANKVDLASLLQLQMTAAINTSRVGKECNIKLLDAKTFGGTVMGGVDPPLFGSKKQAKKWSTAVGEIRRRNRMDLSMTRTADIANSGTVTGNRPLTKLPTLRRAGSQDAAGNEREKIPTLRMAGSQDAGTATQSDLSESEVQKAVGAALGENTSEAADTAEATDFAPASQAEATELPPAFGTTSKIPTVADKEKATKLHQGSNTAEDAAHVTESFSASGQNSTPTHGANRSGMEGPPGDSAELVDTPEPQCPRTRGPGRLKQNQPPQPAKKVDLPPAEPINKGHNHPQDGWTFEEGVEKEYGVSRNSLNANGITKARLDNMKVVMSTYPALVRVVQQKMDLIQASNVDMPEGFWAGQVADEVRGVPFPLQKPWMENDTFQKWYRRLAAPQPEVFEFCQLYFLAKDTAFRGETDRKRSAMLYKEKMKDDVKPKRVVRCAVHAKREHCIPLGK
jgi:hypothetical protein